MLVHDQYSGYVHEVPDQLMGYGLGEVVYDGLGNPVGWNPFQAISRAVSAPLNLVRSAVQGAGNLAQGARNVISSLLPGTPGFVPPPPAAPFPYPSPGGGSTYPQFPSLPPYGGMPQSWPPGWLSPSLPYTGLGPRRLYMRCAVWPGPQGLVPGYAANMPPGAQPGLPGMPGIPGYPGLPVPFGGGRRRRRRR